MVTARTRPIGLLGVRYFRPTFAVAGPIALWAGSVAAQDAPPQRYWSDHMRDGHMMGGDWGWGHMLFGSISMVFFWGALILLVVLLVRWLGDGHSGFGSRRRTALDILEERFARGEIDHEEFDARRRRLTDR